MRTRGTPWLLMPTTLLAALAAADVDARVIWVSSNGTNVCAQAHALRSTTICRPEQLVSRVSREASGERS